MTSKKKWGHDKLASDLAQHLRESKGVLAWEDMQLGPAGSPRPDVYTIGKSFTRFTPLAYECKVSVADFRRDVTAGKWQSYLDFAGAVIFAVPAGLVTKEDIPTGCGLVIRHENCWRTAKGPTLKAVDNLPRKAWLKLLMDGIERQSDRTRVQQREAFSGSWSADRSLRKRYGDELAELINEALRAKNRVQAAIELDNKRRREIQDGTERYAKMHRDRLEHDIGRLNLEQAALARSLGLGPGATILDLTSAIKKAQRRLGEDAEINRLRGFFNSVKNLAEDGLEPLPGIEVETV